MKKAFTLIELLVVMGILGILAAIVMSSVRQIRSESNCLETRERCVSKCLEQEEECLLKE